MGHSRGFFRPKLSSHISIVSVISPPATLAGEDCTDNESELQHEDRPFRQLLDWVHASAAPFYEECQEKIDAFHPLNQLVANIKRTTLPIPCFASTLKITRYRTDPRCRITRAVPFHRVTKTGATREEPTPVDRRIFSCSHYVRCHVDCERDSRRRQIDLPVAVAAALRPVRTVYSNR